MRATRFVALVLVVLAWSAVAGAETIVLKSGKVVTGTIQSMTPSTILVTTPEGTVTVDRTEVLAISLSPAGADATVAAPAATPGTPAVAQPPAVAPQAEDDTRPAAAPDRATRPAPVRPEPRYDRRGRLVRDDPMRPFLDHGGVGAKVILNPYSSVRAHYQDGQPRKIGEVPFSGGLGVFLEFMSKYVGVGLEVDVEFLKADAVWERKEVTVNNGGYSYPTWDEDWSRRPTTGDEARTGVFVHVWPHLRVRIPTEWVDPYFMLQFGYASYSRPFQGAGPYDGVAICPRLGAAVKVSRAVALLVDVGYNFAHLEPRYPENLKINDIEIHNLVLNLGAMYRF